MQLKDYFDFAAPNDIRLKGHRVGIETILFDYLDLGLSAEEIALRYPTLSLEQIHATLAYYGRHQAELDVYLKAAREHEERMIREQERNPSPAVKYLHQLVQGTVPS
ncbi:MAG: DUF433 domain-containing protein [Proteobacteria bacterium]|nr:DUF433 domain-containing protein [Pseudomonadota bacterium]